MSEFDDVGDDRDWARKIMRRYAAGEKINNYPLNLAREVLHLPKPQPVYRAQYGANHATAPAPIAPEQVLTPAEAYYAAEEDARRFSGSGSAMAVA